MLPKGLKSRTLAEKGFILHLREWIAGQSVDQALEAVKEAGMSEGYRQRLQIRHVEADEYLATSRDLPGPVAQAGTVSETAEISRDVAR